MGLGTSGTSWTPWRDRIQQTAKGSGCWKEVAILPPDWDEGAPEGRDPQGVCCGVTSTSEGRRRRPEVSCPARARPEGALLTTAPASLLLGLPGSWLCLTLLLVPQTSAPSYRISFPFVSIFLPRPVVQSCSRSAVSPITVPPCSLLTSVNLALAPSADPHT